MGTKKASIRSKIRQFLYKATHEVFKVVGVFWTIRVCPTFHLSLSRLGPHQSNSAQERNDASAIEGVKQALA
jgi:hypothetical protein